MSKNRDSISENSEVREDRAPRKSTLLVANCERADGSIHAIKVRNISASGLKGECTVFVDFEIDERIRIHFLNQSPMKAQIVRIEDYEVGMAFARKVDVQQLVSLRAVGNLPEMSPRSSELRAWIDRHHREIKPPEVDTRRPV